MIISINAIKTTPWSLPSVLSKNIFRAHEALLGRPTFQLWAELEQTQKLSRTAIKQLQLNRLQQLLTTALQHCPWHAERIQRAGINPQHLDWEQFNKLPLMSKDDARLHSEKIVWKNAPGGVFRYNTGGSTGEPLIFFFGRKRQAADAACRMRAKRWWGLEPGDKEIFLWGAPIELRRTDIIKQIRDRLCNQVLLNAFEMSSKRMDRYIDILNAYKPKSIYGYASSLTLLAEYSHKKKKRLTLPTLKVVYATGEPLYPHQREIISSIFNAPVANEYGARDAGLIALESPRGKMHINSEWIIVEIVDKNGNPVSEGDIGEIVITNLASEVFPFIRYKTGDQGRMEKKQNENSMSLEILKEVYGRSTDFILRNDGTIMHALSLIYVLRETPGIKQFKIIQNKLNEIIVQVVPEPELWQDSNIFSIKNSLKKRVGEETTIKINICEFIKSEKSGKYRYVVSNVKPNIL